MTITLYDLCGADRARRFSPFCWRSKMALLHKGLAFETVPAGFTEKSLFGFADWDKVPVLVDDGRVVTDSPRIAAYLETAYPDRPSLFGGTGGMALTRFVDHWATGVLHPALFRVVVYDIFQALSPADRAYFRATREPRLGKTLEAAQAEAPERLPALHATWQPLNALLAEQPFLGGDTPLYADYIVFGAVQWARRVSETDVIGPHAAIAAWRDRLLQAFDGYAV